MNFLTQHLKDSQISYIAHLKFALYASGQLLFAAIASFIHGVFPFMFKGSAAWVVIKLYNQRLVNHPNQKYQQWIAEASNEHNQS